MERRRSERIERTGCGVTCGYRRMRSSSIPPPSTRDERALVALSYNFLTASQDYLNERYRDAAMAAAQIGGRIFKGEEIANRLSELQGRAQTLGARIIPDHDLANALRLGVEAAIEAGDFDKLTKGRIPKGRVTSFDGLLALAKLRQRR